MRERPRDLEDINRVLAKRYVKAEGEDDPGWYRCVECDQKVYLGDDNASDFFRHERRYHQDSS